MWPYVTEKGQTEFGTTVLIRPPEFCSGSRGGDVSGGIECGNFPALFGTVWRLRNDQDTTHPIILDHTVGVRTVIRLCPVVNVSNNGENGSTCYGFILHLPWLKTQLPCSY